MMLALSGGKDSLACCDLLMRCGAFSRVEAFAMYLVPGLECFEVPVMRAAERFGIPVHFVPHWDNARLLKHAVLRPHIKNAPKIRLQRAKDVQLALTARTSIRWFCYGEKGADSYARLFFTRHEDGVRVSQGRLYAIRDWKDSDVLAYLKARKIPPPRRLSTRKAQGISLEPETLASMKKHYPNDYRKVLEAFPFAEGVVWRWERGDFEKGRSDGSEKEGSGEAESDE